MSEDSAEYYQWSEGGGDERGDITIEAATEGRADQVKRIKEVE